MFTFSTNTIVALVMLTAVSAHSVARVIPKAVLPLSVVTTETAKYLKEKRQMDVREYHLTAVNFTNSEASTQVYYWLLHYACLADEDGYVEAGCDFIVAVSNEKEPQFRVFPGLSAPADR